MRLVGGNTCQMRCKRILDINGKAPLPEELVSTVCRTNPKRLHRSPK